MSMFRTGFILLVKESKNITGEAIGFMLDIYE